MANSSLVEVIMKTAESVIFRAISEIWGKSKRPDEARILYFLKNILDNSEVLDGSFWKE